VGCTRTIPPLGRNRAAAIATRIQRDIDYGEFDASLTKYKPAAALTTVTPITPISTPKHNLTDLWELYVTFKTPQVMPSTVAVDYRKYRNHIANLPTKELEDAIAIRDYLIANLTPDTVKRVLTNINACCDWALKSKLIDSNPFDGMMEGIHVPKSDSEEADINPWLTDKTH
jgi:integrase